MKRLQQSLRLLTLKWSLSGLVFLQRLCKELM
uniref:Uncharacterized protein n=1 Tax=Syphacia muris TaxID=451379 RepID=A0A0N5AAK1_9BILA